MTKKIAIAGATGFIGSKIVANLIQNEFEVVIIGRNIERAKKIFPNCKYFADYSLNHLTELENCYAFINLAGTNILSRRWNDDFKDSIISSRVNTTRAIINLISKLNNKPKVLINASAIGYYGNSETKTFSENDLAGNEFLSKVCEKWENESQKVSEFNIRNVSIRIGIVLSKEGGALQRMIIPFKLFIGGPIADGPQWFSWIHIDDLVNLFIYAINNQEMTGAYNATAPNPVRMKHFTNILGQVLKRPSFFIVPKFILQLIFGEGADMLTKGNRVLPTRTIESGFIFTHPNLEGTIRDILK